MPRPDNINVEHGALEDSLRLTLTGSLCGYKSAGTPFASARRKCVRQQAGNLGLQLLKICRFAYAVFARFLSLEVAALLEKNEDLQLLKTGRRQHHSRTLE